MRLSLLALLSLITFGCQPDFAKVDPVDSDPNNTAEPSSEPSTEPTDPDTEPPEPDPVDPTEDPNTLRCCYGIEMYDQMGDGWQRSLLSVITDDGVYANVSLPEGFVNGFREVCIDQGENITFSWNPGLDNDQIGLAIFSYEGEDFFYGEQPPEGILAETISTCSDEYAVDQSYPEYDSTQDPEIPDEYPTDTAAFAGEHIGIFEMFSHDTGEQLCMVDMVANIDDNGIFTASEVCPVYGHSVLVSHNGYLYPEIVENYDYGDSFGFGYLTGTVEITDDTGMIQVESEFYGECVLEGGMTYINVYWDSYLYPPNGSPQSISGQFYYPY